MFYNRLNLINSYLISDEKTNSFIWIIDNKEEIKTIINTLNGKLKLRINVLEILSLMTNLDLLHIDLLIEDDLHILNSYWFAGYLEFSKLDIQTFENNLIHTFWPSTLFTINTSDTRPILTFIIAFLVRDEEIDYLKDYFDAYSSESEGSRGYQLLILSELPMISHIINYLVKFPMLNSNILSFYYLYTAYLLLEDIDSSIEDKDIFELKDYYYLEAMEDNNIPFNILDITLNPFIDDINEIELINQNLQELEVVSEKEIELIPIFIEELNINVLELKQELYLIDITPTMDAAYVKEEMLLLMISESSQEFAKYITGIFEANPKIINNNIRISLLREDVNISLLYFLKDLLFTHFKIGCNIFITKDELYLEISRVDYLAKFIKITSPYYMFKETEILINKLIFNVEEIKMNPIMLQEQEDPLNNIWFIGF